MKVFVALLLIASGLAEAQTNRKRLLVIAESKGWQHDSISHAMATLERLGKETGIWDTYLRTDTQLVTKKKPTGLNIKNLDYFDAVAFFTTGLHPQYHRVTDEVPLIDFEKLANVARLMEEVGRAVGERGTRPR